jgi:hypothetical protein
MMPLQIRCESTAEDATLAVTTRLLSEDDEARWDAFVRACPEATFFHLSSWRKVIERAFGPKYQFMINLWKRLPLSIASLIGPRLARDLG